MFKSQIVYFGFLLISCQSICYGRAANILAMIPASSPSHHMMHTTILEELAVRGHNVCLLITI